MISGRDLAARIGTVGAWSHEPDRLPVREAQRFASAIEGLGYKALWIPESAVSRDIFAHVALLLAATERLVIATGIANIWARDPVAMRNGERALLDAYPGRLLLGLGVSHAPAVKRRGGSYERPVERMREYMDAMEKARYAGPEPAEPPARVLAALGPRMLDLARERTGGAHPYFVPVAHTRIARARLGPGPLLAVEAAGSAMPDVAAARANAREHMKGYLRLDNYANNLRRLGFTGEDIAGPSDQLVDEIVAHGGVDGIAERVRAHQGAGADHVCVQVVDLEPLRVFRDLAKALKV